MRELHIGRLIDHVHLRARDLETTKRFYRAVLGALGKPISADDERHLACDELWIDALGDDSRHATHVHLASQVSDRDAVRRFYKAGLAAGGRDNGEPGERPYHPDTSAPCCWTRTVTTSKRSTTARRNVRRSRS